MTTIQIFQALKPRLGEVETEALVEYIDTRMQENNKEIHEWNLRTLATKEDLFMLRDELKEKTGELKGEIGELRVELQAEIAELRGELKGEIAELRGDIKEAIAGLKGEFRSLRWFIPLFITIVLAIIGLYFKH